jgi:hypothetical protein
MTNNQPSKDVGGQLLRPSSFVLRQLASSLPTVTLLILALLAAAPVWGPGIVNTRAGGDSPFLLWRTQQMALNLHAGIFPVRWMPDAAYGYGYPFFNYYSVLPYYLAALLNVVGLDILTAIKLTQTLGFIAAAFAMYGWTRRHFSRASAWLAATTYTFAAFHLVNVYTRGDSLSEFYAFVFYPLILWGMDRTFERRDKRSIVALALAFGGLLMTHNLSAFIFAPFVLLYIIIQTSNLQSPISNLQSRISNLWPCALGLTLGLALSAWCWIPQLGETSYVQLGEQTTGYFNYSNHFRGVNLVQPTLAFDYDVGTTTPFAMSSAQAALAAIGVVAIAARAIRRRRLDRLPTFTLIGLVISTWLITPLSKPVWDHAPFWPLLQFPWRYLSAQAVFTALATAQIFFHEGTPTILCASSCPSWSHSVGAGVCGLLLAFTALANLHPDRLYISPADVTTERLQLYEMFTANIGTTIRYEWLPSQVVPRLYTSDALIEPGKPIDAVALEGDAKAARSTAAPTRQEWHVTAGPSGATMAFPILWWPGWQARVDGKPAPIRPATSSGRIVLDVASGEHTVVLSLGRTPLRAMAETMSLIAAIVIPVTWLRNLYRKGAKATKANRIDLGRLGVLAVIFFVALAVFVARSVPVATADDETMDFNSQPYLHHNPGGAELGSGLRLMSYHLSADELSAGQMLDVGLNWTNATSAETVTVRLVSPAQHLPGLEGAPTLAQSVAVVPSGTTRTDLSLPIPPDTPRGVYLLQVSAGQNLAYLRPVHIRNEAPVGDAPVLAQFADRIRLHRVYAEQVTPTQLAVTLDWSAAQPVEANYAIRIRLFNTFGDVTTPVNLYHPGYGFLPTSIWRPGNLISDRYLLDLPEGTPPNRDYQIEVLLYDRATLAGVGQYIQLNVLLPQVSRRALDSPTLARFGPEMALATLDVPARHEQGQPTLDVSAGWLATAAQSANRVARWTIYDAHGTPVMTQTIDLATGSPSSAWPAGAYVVGKTRLDIPNTLSAGTYRLGVTLLNLATHAEEGSFFASSSFEIVGHPRSFVVPPMQHRCDIEFGQQIKLLGYDTQSQISNLKSQVTLTLYWQAVTAPRDDYKVFVHLFDPTNEQIVAQHDAMPCDGRYPTSWWTAGEIVSETITFSLGSVKPGAWRLAVGLYEPRTATRLAALGPDGTRLAADRLVLPEDITLPK